jgi:uncharacterized protein (TIGR02466 family)
MNNDYKLYSIFPTPILINQFAPSKELTLFFSNVKPHPMFKEEVDSSYAGYYSEDLHILRNKECEELRSFILANAMSLATEVLGHNVKGLADVLSWVSFKTRGEEHKAHTHPNSFISGVYYYSDVAEDTPIVFKRARSSTNSQELLVAKDNININQFSSETFTLKPKKGDLILFPSYLMHYVPKNPHDTIRTSVAVNIMPTKEAGEEVFLTHFRYDDALGS